MHAQLTSALVAAGDRGLDPTIVRPGWLALGIVAALGVGLYFLLRSFAKHAKRAAQPWEGESSEPEVSDPAGSDSPTSR